MRHAGLMLILALGYVCPGPAWAEADPALAPLLLAPPAQLSAHFRDAQRLRLACSEQEECLSLKLSPAWRAPRSTPAPLTRVSNPSHPRAERTGALRPAKSVPFSVGKRVALKSGRELSLQLTPTPTRCAPLFQVTY
ncbi:MAG TPA: hypothetical protein VMF89_32260 [Polyangiales bacterium]|nr:hypothetical protein [Polyangiales bacterium]